MDDDTGGGPSTRAVHGGENRPGPGGPVVFPVYQSATFFNEPVPADEVRYTRYGTNPNHEAIARKLASLDGADAALVLSSGNAAMALALLACARSGDRVLAARALYGGTLRILNRELPRLGISVDTVDADDADSWAASVSDGTRALLMELPVNPTLRVPDIEAASRVARAHGAPLIVDATFATPVNCRPLEHGADLVVHSATKYLGGHSDLSAGVVAGRADLVAEVHELLKSFGPVLDPHATWLLNRGIKSLDVRMARHNENGMTLARWLSEHPAIEDVFYPGLESHPDHARANRLMRGFGGVVSATVRGGDEVALDMLRRLEVISVAPSLGGVESLVSMPRYTSHAALDRAARHALGIGDGFVRFAFGIEDAVDLIADVDRALARATGAT